jgi:hypothetical protein
MGSHSAPRGRAGRTRRFELERDRRSRPQGSTGARLFVIGWACYAFAAVQAGLSNHAAIGYYLLSVLVWILLPIPGVAAIVLGERLAAASTTERPRWFYAAMAVVLFSPALVTVVAFVRLDGRQPSWWTNGSIEQALAVLAVFALMWCTLMSVLMLGRAVLRNRLRLRCWINQPRWLCAREDSSGH